MCYLVNTSWKNFNKNDKLVTREITHSIYYTSGYISQLLKLIIYKINNIHINIQNTYIWMEWETYLSQRENKMDKKRRKYKS